METRHQQRTLVGVAIAIVFSCFMASGASRVWRLHGYAGLPFSPALAGGAFVLAILLVLETHNRPVFGGRFRECASLVAVGIVPAFALGAWTEGASASSGTAFGALAAGIVGLSFMLRAAMRVQTAAALEHPRWQWRALHVAGALGAAISFYGATHLDADANFVRGLPVLVELPQSEPMIASEPPQTVSFKRLRLTRQASCAVHIEGSSVCVGRAPHTRTFESGCGAVRLHGGKGDKVWIEAAGRDPRMVFPDGSMADADTVFSYARRVRWVDLLAALAGLIIGLASLIFASRARRRADLLDGAVDATHRGGGWMSPEDDRPPVHVPSASAEEPGPVLLVGAASFDGPQTYRHVAAPTATTYERGTRDRALATAREAERGHLTYGILALLISMIPLLGALVTPF